MKRKNKEVLSGAAVIPMISKKEEKEEEEKVEEKDNNLFVHIVNAEFSWSSGGFEEKRQDEFRLCDVNFRIKKGELVAVTGRVGSGKSSLLLSILKSTHKIRGTMFVNFTSPIAYVPQVPFIFSGTVLSNIVLDRPVNQNLLKNAIAAAAMDRDLTLMPFGLQTVIGERGVTLSGGQKMVHVSLFRNVNINIFYFPFPPFTNNVVYPTIYTASCNCTSSIWKSRVLSLGRRVSCSGWSRCHANMA